MNMTDFVPGKNVKIVASIDSDPLLQARIAKVLGADILEIRLDLLEIKEAVQAKKLFDFLDKQDELLCIATNRVHSEGGNWQGQEEQRIALLEDLIPYVDMIDIERKSTDCLRNRLVEEAKSHGTKVIMSSHFFETTPPEKEMVAILNECTDKGADIAKLAVMPQKPEDILELFHAALQAKGEVCVIAMGELGRHSRVVACRYGSLLTYGCVEKPVAPGQIRIDQLKMALETII